MYSNLWPSKSRSIWWARTSPNVIGWRFHDLHDGEKTADLSQTVFMQLPTKHSNGKIYTHTHIHTPTNTGTSSDKCKRQECNALHFAWKSGYRLTLWDISWWKVVCLHFWYPWHPNDWYRRPLHISHDCAYRPESLSALCTRQCFRIESLTLKMKVKDVDNLEWKLEDGGSLWTCMCAKIGASRSSRLFAIHNHTFRDRQTYGRMERTNEWTNERTYILPAYTVQLRKYGVKILEMQQRCVSYQCIYNILYQWRRVLKFINFDILSHIHTL